MYQPKRYQKNDGEFIFDFICHHPFATLVSHGHRLMATHIPVLVEGNSESFRLFAHIANHNEQLGSIKNGSEVLLIFQGAHAYVSSSWYQEKNISTWDYSAVHINAQITLQSSAELEDSLKVLVHQFEKKQEEPLFYKDIPEEMLMEHLPLITGFWCDPTHMEGIAKLHQGYPKEDVSSVISNLDKEEDLFAGKVARDIEREHKT